MTLEGRFGACPIHDQRIGHRIQEPRQDPRSDNEGPTVRHEAPRVHHATRWRGCVAARGARATTTTSQRVESRLGIIESDLASKSVKVPPLCSRTLYLNEKLVA